MDIEVECYCGHRGEETPRRIRFAERKVEVLEVIDRWLSPDHRYFKVRGNDQGTYIIRHDMKQWKWELTAYQDCAEGDK
jgi:hypothetical protein